MNDATEACDVSRRKVLVMALASSFGLTSCATTQTVDVDAAEKAAKDAADKAAAKKVADKAAADRAVAERAAAAKQATERAAALQLESDKAQERHRLAMQELDRATARVEALENAIRIEPTDVTPGSLNDLIRVMRKKSGGRLDRVSAKSVTDDLARVFVDNAWDAVDSGYPVPDWIVRRLPPRKVAFPILGVMYFTVGSVGFVVPVATFFMVTIAAVVVTGSVMAAAVAALLQPSTTKKT